MNTTMEPFYEKKIELLLEMQNKHMMDGFGKILQALQQLSNQVALLQRSTQAIPASPSSVPSEPVSLPVHPQEPNPEAAPSNRPRYGDYKPEEVSVSKFFYFGNKK